MQVHGRLGSDAPLFDFELEFVVVNGMRIALAHGVLRELLTHPQAGPRLALQAAQHQVAAGDEVLAGVVGVRHLRQVLLPEQTRLDDAIHQLLEAVALQRRHPIRPGCPQGIMVRPGDRSPITHQRERLQPEVPPELLRGRQERAGVTRVARERRQRDGPTRVIGEQPEADLPLTRFLTR